MHRHPVFSKEGRAGVKERDATLRISRLLAYTKYIIRSIFEAFSRLLAYTKAS
jgi:hypothetical protein